MPAKPPNQNIVRDRTLVLRILVPGLHTRLNDKINNLQESGATSTPTSSGGLEDAAKNTKAENILNLEGVTCLPSSNGSTLWHFRCDGATYPARLVNLPCPVEVHKTVDHATYHKSADVGQMLLVYEDEYAMQEAEAEKPIEGFPSYYHSGLTPPMKRVVRRRFLSRMEERDVKPVPPKREEVHSVEMEIKKLIEKLSDKKQGKGKNKPSSKEKVIEEVEEEIVDYEPWMGEGGTFTIEDAKLHPEWWLSKAEIKKIEDVKQEAIRKEREAQEAKLAEQEAKRLADEAAAEKKAKKKEKKKKKKQQEEEAAEAAKAPSAAEEPIDEVTAAAMTISQGIDNEELLLDDDMFDFENEDISDLFT